MLLKRWKLWPLFFRQGNFCSKRYSELVMITQLASCRIMIYTSGSAGLQTPTLPPSLPLSVSSSHLLLSPATSCWAKQSRKWGKMTSPRGESGVVPGAHEAGLCSLSPWACADPPRALPLTPRWPQLSFQCRPGEVSALEFHTLFVQVRV